MEKPRSTENSVEPHLSIRAVSEHSKNVEDIKELYKDAFPAKERSPFREFFHENNFFLAFYDDEDEMCGFASLLSYRDLTHILYFAIDPELRGQGYGSAALKLMRQHLKTHKLLVDVEAEDESAPNNSQRIKRKEFYFRNGYAESGIRYIWQGEKYEILISGGVITEDEFEIFWSHFRLEGELPQYY